MAGTLPLGRKQLRRDDEGGGVRPEVGEEEAESVPIDKKPQI